MAGVRDEDLRGVGPWPLGTVNATQQDRVPRVRMPLKPPPSWAGRLQSLFGMARGCAVRRNALRGRYAPRVVRSLSPSSRRRRVSPSSEARQPIIASEPRSPRRRPR